MAVNGELNVRRAVIDDKEQIPRQETIALRHKHVGPSCKLFFNKDPLKMVRASGQYMYNESDEEFLDCINNVCHVGHCHPHVVKAGQQQMAILNTNSRFLHDNLVLYAERIASKFPGDLRVVFFVNSGSEANDLALRMCTAYSGSKEVITLDHAYHGHVISLMEISPYKFNKAGTGCPPHTHVAPVPDVYRGVHRDTDHPGQDMAEVYADHVKNICDKLSAQGSKPSCFIAESLQSCGGQIIYPEGYLKRVYEHVRSAGGLCIADEVQVGFGRVGSPNWWAFELQDVVPDIVTVGKPMGNGHPVAAVVTTNEVAKKFLETKVEYFNTFGGNPVSCAIASAVLDVIEDEKLMDHSKEVGLHLKQRLNQLKSKHSIIGDVRGHGLFVGVDLIDPTSASGDPRAPHTRAAEHILARMKEDRILIQSDGPHNNVLKLKPPLVFNKANADKFVDTLDAIIDEMKAMDKM